MLNFKVYTILEFEAECIADARRKLKEIFNQILEETYVTKIKIDMDKCQLFEERDLK